MTTTPVPDLIPITREAWVHLFKIGLVINAAPGYFGLRVVDGVVVPTPSGMRKPLEMIGKRLLDFYCGRFALTQPVQHTDNERQTLVAALRLLQDALSASQEGEEHG